MYGIAKFEQYITSTITLVKPIAMVLQTEDNWHLAEKICDDYTFLDRREVLITVILTTLSRAFTGRRNSHSALCAVRKVYFSAQPNNLKLILDFQKYYPIEHIFVPACSSARKEHFFKF